MTRLGALLLLLALSGCVGPTHARAVISSQCPPPAFIDACMDAAPRAGFSLRSDEPWLLTGKVVRDKAPDPYSAVKITIDPDQAEVLVRHVEEAAQLAARLQSYVKGIQALQPSARLEFLEVDGEVVFDALHDR